MAKATGHMRQEATTEYKSKLAKAVEATEKRPEKDYMTKAEAIDLSQAFYDISLFDKRRLWKFACNFFTKEVSLHSDKFRHSFDKRLRLFSFDKRLVG